MTDEEIVKAIAESVCNPHSCSDCPFENSCADELLTEAFNLINRQRIEIEGLKGDYKSLNKRMEWLTGYNGNLIDANTALSGEIELLKEAEENLT